MNNKKQIIDEAIRELDMYEIQSLLILLGNPNIDYEPHPRIKDALDKLNQII
jgi:hypothetical protein